RLQLAKPPGWSEIRRRNAGVLAERLGRLAGLRVPLPGDEVRHAYYKFYAFVRPERLKEGWDRDRVQGAIAAEGIPVFSGSCSEIYLEKAFTPELRPAERLPVARELGETSLMFLVHPTLSEAEIEDACRAVEKVMAVATA
ncbi:MAG: DegT/DnrJ/EryC1/StrS family aminotransferase, partial [Candidatus Sericytochromatia bacterium]